MLHLKKIALGALLALFFLPALAQTRKVELSGTITSLNGREVAVYNIKTREFISRVHGNGDNFKISLEVDADEAIPYYINIPHVGGFEPSMKIPSFWLFLDAPVIAIEANIDRDSIVSSTSIKGSRLMEEVRRLEKENPYSSLLSEVTDIYNKRFDVYNRQNIQTDENFKLLRAASDSMDVLNKKVAGAYLDMIDNHRDNKALAFIVSGRFSNAPLQKRKEIMAGFSPSILASYPLERLAESIRVEEKSSEGQPLPDFNVYTIDGKPDKLSKYKGEYLLIDFWASWCGPCIKEMPNLKSVYTDYKAKGLKLVSISVDEDLDKWKKAIEEIGLTNLQLHDKEKVTSKLLNYQGIPFIVLVSPEGKILERNLRGENIRKKVKQYLD